MFTKQDINEVEQVLFEDIKEIHPLNGDNKQSKHIREYLNVADILSKSLDKQGQIEPKKKEIPPKEEYSIDAENIDDLLNQDTGDLNDEESDENESENNGNFNEENPNNENGDQKNLRAKRKKLVPGKEIEGGVLDDTDFKPGDACVLNLTEEDVEYMKYNDKIKKTVQLGNYDKDQYENVDEDKLKKCIVDDIEELKNIKNENEEYLTKTLPDKKAKIDASKEKLDKNNDSEKDKKLKKLTDKEKNIEDQKKNILDENKKIEEKKSKLTKIDKDSFHVFMKKVIHLLFKFYLGR